ncbi:MAG: DUF2029 domain-containing protein [Planctomycetes bacterium]|nr:DUF2029 domain-containing protein [Planctomycetota bacterium]
MLGFRDRPLVWAALLWAVLCLGICVRVYREPTRQTVWHDYGAAGRAWVHGTDAYNLDRDDGQVIPTMSGFRYAPVVSVLLAPFGVLPESAGAILWRLFSVGCLLAAFGWYLRAALPGCDVLADKEKALLWLLLLPLSLASINNGQANVLLMALLLGGATATVKERWNVAAVLLAGACLLKIYPVAIALLLIVAYPRQLSWRFLAATMIGLVLPFLLQSPSYVWHQYENWLALVASDNRRDFDPTQGYRDFYLLLTRIIGISLTPKVYLGVQLAAGALVAGVGLLGKLRGWSAKYLVTTLLTLGCAWMVVFGPSIESCTYIQIAPALSWALIDANRPSCPRWSRYALWTVFALFAGSYVTAWFKESRDWLYLAQPIAALLFFLERCARSVVDAPAEPVPSVVPESNRRAA